MRIIYHSIDKACNIMIIYHNLKTNKIDEEYTHAQHRPEILNYLELNLLNNLIKSNLLKTILSNSINFNMINFHENKIKRMGSMVDIIQK